MRNKVEIPQDIIDVWEAKYKRGDYAIISEMAYGSSEYRGAVRQALAFKQAEQKLADAIIEFYLNIVKMESNDLDKSIENEMYERNS